MNLFSKTIIVLCVFFAATPIFASNIEGTDTYKDYIFVLIHGFQANEKIFKGEDTFKFGNLKAFLESPIDKGGLELTGRVFCYTFNDVNGSNYDHARELGDNKYHNPRPEMNGLCWLNKAKADFVSSHRPGTLVPSKFILITHSMGNLAARCYVYSDKVFGAGKGFYRNDIAKVVFIAPPLLGSDGVLAATAFWGHAGWKGFAETWQLMDDYKKNEWLKEITDGLNPGKSFTSSISRGDNGEFKISDFHYNLDWKEIWNILMNPGSNPFYAYFAGAIIAGLDIWGDQLWKNGFGYSSLKPWEPGMVEMMPYDMPSYDLGFMGRYTPLTKILKDAELSDPAQEPAYSIVYGRGIPVCDWKTSLAMTGVKGYNDYFKQNAFIPSLNYGLLSLPLLGQFPTNQGKLMSVTLAAIFNSGFMTNDGDGLVPTYSARGEGVVHLKNAIRYEHVFKTEHYEKYLSEQLPIEVTVTEAAIAATAAFMAWGGTPYPVAWKNLWWMRIPTALSLVGQTFGDIRGLQWDVEAHGHILEQYDLIKTAILDTQAIFTINDIQARISAEANPSPEASGALSFSASAAVPSGLESVKIKGVTENRTAMGSTNLPVPMTLDGDRKYVISMTMTQPPQRIAGKLNYLIPKLMKSFEYSFNFAAWKPIQNVNPETGEFVLEGLPFAEGQNLIAVRSENAVGIKSHQLLKIVLNSIPCLPSQYQPEAGSYTNKTKPKIGVEFRKAKFVGKTAGFQVISCQLDGADISPTLTEGSDDYTEWFKVEYTPPEPLPDGEHQVAVKIQSEVGISQALWPFVVDTVPPSITIQPMRPVSFR